MSRLNEARLPGYTTYKDPALQARIAKLYGSGLTQTVLRERFPGLTSKLLSSILKKQGATIRKAGRNYLADGLPV